MYLHPSFHSCLVRNQAVKAMILEHKQIIINQINIILYLIWKVTIKIITGGAWC